MPAPFDFKKHSKELYSPTAKPSIIEVPEMVFITIDGQGNPNTSKAYAEALEILYSLSYSIKMSKGDSRPEGFFDYVVPPLEGLWWGVDSGAGGIDKDKLCWTSMIRQPDFVTQEVFERAKTALGKKKPELDTTKASLMTITEGLCAQILHIGSYDDEPATMKALETYIGESGYRPDFSDTRKHHEIYLSDPRKVAPEKLKTIIRLPIAKN
ncbi:MAG: GyrI-like domain-containing protein [Holophagaceae bacterium]|nr:GyrI-like domain-containing protein [Holophagaceae bacterium]